MKIYGHRGARGLFPENTLEGFKQTVALGVDGIELDVVVSGDGQLVVSHEPWMSAEYCLDPHGNPITRKEEKKHNLYQMDYATIKTYDVGTKEHPRFKKQEHYPAYKPLLKEVMIALKDVSNDFKLFVELKSEQEDVGTFYPNPQQYARLVYEELQGHLFNGVIIVKSFDPYLMNAMHALKPNFQLGFLVFDDNSLEANLGRLFFTPDYLNPCVKFITPNYVHELTEMGIQCVPWTVNYKTYYNKLKEFGVEGMITDYPNLFL